MIIQDRCRIHAAKADNVGMYTTANVLTHAAQAIEVLTAMVERLEKALEERMASKVSLKVTS